MSESGIDFWFGDGGDDQEFQTNLDLAISAA
jgi:hypothetical protein